MDETLAHPLGRGAFRATITGVGRPGPIEERVGRRLVRVVNPDSKEGLDLLKSGRVTLVGPEGRALGCRDLADALRLLRRRLEDRLAGGIDPDSAVAIREGIVRLRRAGRG